ncbi:MAG: peptide-methionine (S)-S-oxide reductase, partial [Candidatus Aegiribacteria sp.]|nr:peptide-methionine (S)-S-oxide reductase [Candidatus Aegiribacteria sp.]
PTQINRQGSDTGTQYRSAVFYTTNEQLAVLEELVRTLRNRGYEVVSELIPAGDFWSAEDCHQNYFDKNGIDTSCHTRVCRFPM